MTTTIPFTVSVLHSPTFSISITLPHSPKFVGLPIYSSSHYPSLFHSQIRITSPSYYSSINCSNNDVDDFVEVLRVPHHWLEPSKALQESEWLRVALHKWLDDEYCPEPTNVDISKVAADSYYQSLMQKTTDLGEILLKMAHELESISYQESFHGAFSSANAAVALIADRIEQD